MREDLVLGLGGCVDYEIEWDSSVLESLVEEYAIRADELSTDVPVVGERELVVCLLAYLRDGRGGEGFVADSLIVEKFAARFPTRITLGGTCVRAAIAMEKLGVSCTLHLVSIDDHARRLLPRSAAWVCSADQDSLDPHLIVQYHRGAHVAAGDIDITAPHPNRTIWVNDPPNRNLVLAPELADLLTHAKVFVISGFNVMQDEAVLRDRLTTLRKHMANLPKGALVFFEDGGYHEPKMSKIVRGELADLLDIYSLNEDELQGYLGRSVDLLDPQSVLEALAELRPLIPVPALVVHTKYWALSSGPNAARYYDALRGGVTMATTRFAHGDHYGLAEYNHIGSGPADPDGAAFCAAVADLAGDDVSCVASIDVQVKTPTTVGLGDTFVGGFVAALATHLG